MIKTMIIVRYFAYSELPKEPNMNAAKIRDSWQYDARASRCDKRRTTDARYIVVCQLEMVYSGLTSKTITRWFLKILLHF